MLAFFKRFSEKRSSWLLLAFSSLALELTALYFQYGMGLQPCVLCVYERLAMSGLFFAGIIG
ncbi:disulfide bond formation protein B, partial [Rodentibacter pneumotropicus]